MTQLLGKTAIVTGAAQGIGRGIALVLAQDGADIAIADVDEPRARETAGEIAALGRKALAVRCDLIDQRSLQAMVDRVLAEFGKIDILVNNAGVYGAAGWQREERWRSADWDATFQVNVRGTVFCSEAVAPHMIGRRAGKIVNIGSSASREASPLSPHYHASKAGVLMYTQCLALQLAPYDINVNCVCPAMVWTQMQIDISNWRYEVKGEQAASPRSIFEERMRKRCPLGRDTTPEDIGWAVSFLASDRARNMTGQALHVDGGAVMR